MPAPGPITLSRVTRILVLCVAAVGFLFDTYELLMFPLIGNDSIAELKFHLGFTALDDYQRAVVQYWLGQMLWIAALCGGAFGLLGGWLIDRLGRKRIMVASILLYSIAPVAAAFSTELWQLIACRCLTFVGVCVELVAAVTWLAELFQDKRTRERVLGWTLAVSSLGGIFVTEVYNAIVAAAKTPGGQPTFMPFPAGHLADNTAWRYTLLTGLVPGALILVLSLFVPESAAWRERKLAGTLRRPSFRELFSPALIRITLVTTVLSACGYAAAFGALQLTPSAMVPGLPNVKALEEEKNEAVKATTVPAEKKAAGVKFAGEVKAIRGEVQRWQEIGGLTGRILLAVLILVLPSRTLLRVFLVPGLILLPLTYLFFIHQPYIQFTIAYFFCGLVTIGQFSFMSEYLPKVFPLHLRGTGGSFASNVGGRMIGTLAATLNTGVLSGLFGGGPLGVATAAAVISGAVYLIALAASFFLPNPPAGDLADEPPGPAPVVPPQATDTLR